MAEEKLEFGDFLNISNTGDLQKFIRGFKEIEKAQLETRKSLIESNELIEKSLRQNVEAAKDLQEQLRKNTKTDEERRKTIERVNKEAEELLNTQKMQEGQLKDNNKQIDKLDENLKDLEKSQKKLNKQEKDALKLRKQEEKLQDILLGNNEKEVRLKQQINREAAAQRREIKNLLILEDELSGTEEKLLAQNELLRIERRKLNTETDKGAQRLKEINDEIDKNNELLTKNSDKVKANKLNVGNYKDSVKEALAETDLFNGALGELGGIGQSVISTLQNIAEGLKTQEQAQDAANEAVDEGSRALQGLDKVAKGTVILLLVGAVLSLGKALSASRRAQLEFQVRSAQLGETLKVVGDRLILVGKTAFDFGEIVANTFDKAGLQLDLFALKAKDLNPFSDQSEQIAAVEGEIDRLDKRYGELTKNIRDNLNNAVKGFGDTVATNNKQLEIALRLEFELNDIERRRNRELAIINGRLEKFNAIAGDSTRSFNEQESAARRVLEIEEERIDLQAKTARERLDIAQKLVENDLRAVNLLDQTNSAEIRSLEILEDRNLALALQESTIEKLSQASIELASIEAERAVSAIEAQRQIAEINRDRFEQELDFALDVFDRQKSVNERIIADDTRTFEERFKLLDKTKRLNESSFESQIQLTQDFIKTSTEEQLKLAKTREGFDQDEIDRLQRKFDLAQKVDIAALTQLEDERDVRKALIAQGIADEITQNRIREIIIERKAAIQDLAEAERDLLAEFAEFSKTLERDLRRIQEDFAGEQLQIDTQQLERLIQLRKELESIDDESISQEERAKKRKEILNEITKLEEDAAKDRNDIIVRELELQKATIEQELSEIEGSTRKELELKEELQAQLVQIESEITQNKIDQERAKVEEVEKSTAEQQKIIEERSKQINKALADLTKQGIAFVNTLFDAQKQRNQDDLTELQILKENELALAGDNEQRKIEIQREFFQKEQEIRAKQRETLRKQAIFNKAVAATEIVVNTAQAIARTLAEVPKFDFGISTGVLVGAYAALGAAQLATVLAAPIPRFEKGTNFAPEGLAITDEKGAEIHTDMRGRIKDTGSDKGARLKYLKRGDKIIPASKTADIMAVAKTMNGNELLYSSLNGALKAKNDLTHSTTVVNRGLTKEEHQDVMNKAMRKIKVEENHWNEKGFRVYMREKNARIRKQQQMYGG